jgi:hypothetical protein
MVKERIESTPTLSLYTQGVEVRGEGYRLRAIPELLFLQLNYNGFH